MLRDMRNAETRLKVPFSQRVQLDRIVDSKLEPPIRLEVSNWV